MTPGACAGNAVADATKIASSPGRSCAPGPSCEEQLCKGDVPAGYGACIEKSGVEAQCPAGWGTPMQVADGYDLSCSACSCDVNSGSSCGAASLDIFADGGCSSKLATMAVDGQCQANPAVGQYAGAFMYHATVNEVCAASGPKTATPVAKGERTICCKP